jgi:hypothetical protein
MSTIPAFLDLLSAHGSTVLFHRDGSVTPCPCRTPEGFRSPEWHKLNPGAPVCNRAGMLPDPSTTVDVSIHGFVQPIQSTRATRLTDEILEVMFGEVQQDDHLGIFPVEWASTYLNFYDWGGAVEDWVVYNSRKYTVVNANLIPDPDDGNPEHHWEVGLRLVR